jgi:hypothetical protein
MQHVYTYIRMQMVNPSVLVMCFKVEKHRHINKMCLLQRRPDLANKVWRDTMLMLIGEVEPNLAQQVSNLSYGNHWSGSSRDPLSFRHPYPLEFCTDPYPLLWLSFVPDVKHFNAR